MPIINVHQKLSPRSLRAAYTGHRLRTPPRRLLFAAIAHWAPMGKRGRSAQLAAKNLTKEQEFFRWMVRMGGRLFQAQEADKGILI